MRPNKSRTFPIKANILALIHAALLAASKAQNHLVLLRDNFCEIHLDSGCVDSPARGISRIVRHLRPMHHGLRRRASHVDARPSQIPLLDKRHRPTQVREAKSEGISGLARADNDGVIFHGRVLHCDCVPRLYIGCCRTGEDGVETQIPPEPGGMRALTVQPAKYRVRNTGTPVALTSRNFARYCAK